MAEIKAGRRRTVRWSWILGLIVVALLAWIAADAVVDGSPRDAAGDRPTRGTASEAAPAEPPPLPWPVAAIETRATTAVENLT